MKSIIGRKPRFFLSLIIWEAILMTFAIFANTEKPIVCGIATALTIFIFWRGLQTGFVLTKTELIVRHFLPGTGRKVPISQLKRLDVDKPIVGSSDNNRPVDAIRLRFGLEHEEEPIDVVGCSKSSIKKVVAWFREKRLPTHVRSAID